MADRNPAGKKPVNKHFWAFRAAAEESAAPELILYGDIASETWWGDEVTPRQFSDELNALGAVAEIVVRINSGGGDVFAANAIYTRLKDNKAKIIVKIDGWAGSAATIIAMAGDVIEIPGKMEKDQASYNKRCDANQKNGKNGGRPKKRSTD